MILDRSVSVLAQDTRCQTCLHRVLAPRLCDGSMAFIPRAMLQKALIRMLQAGADIYATDDEGATPTHKSRQYGVEMIWRHALQACGGQAEKVYAASAVPWTVRRDVYECGELQEALRIIQALRRPSAYIWALGTLQSLLDDGIRHILDQDILKSLVTVACECGPDSENVLRVALDKRGHDLRAIYHAANVSWRELETYYSRVWPYGTRYRYKKWNRNTMGWVDEMNV